MCQNENGDKFELLGLEDIQNMLSEIKQVFEDLFDFLIKKTSDTETDVAIRTEIIRILVSINVIKSISINQKVNE
ncbi:MAG: hypothetical protein V1910_00105 [bacterium]